MIETAGVTGSNIIYFTIRKKKDFYVLPAHKNTIELRTSSSFIEVGYKWLLGLSSDKFKKINYLLPTNLQKRKSIYTWAEYND